MSRSFSNTSNLSHSAAGHPGSTLTHPLYSLIGGHRAVDYPWSFISLFSSSTSHSSSTKKEATRGDKRQHKAT
ncbi:hypothetical protein CBR_g20443 [Chara braunii]|uniref:Uncharacterized protein n=1 Tax=Chara braunii TaxID=69332 RepID=A0A388JUM1_CHABU|nr:hypothetical protein CBR_g20443 [Chara braunii]|eukprot:GBG61412.1 hypothetical protein CBR_g20443 [Chara braunii]